MLYLLIFLAGFIDSVIGGGGLISLPALTVEVGVGSYAIGTNKVLASVAALASLGVFALKGHFKFKQSLEFGLASLLGTIMGSSLGPLIPTELLYIFMLAVIPLVALLLIKKNQVIVWLKNKNVSIPVWSGGLICGLYDGAFGPGAGLFMFIFLHALNNQPVLMALTSAKFANSLTAVGSLINYSRQELVLWPKVLPLTPIILTASLMGAYFSTKYLEQYLKPLLVTILIFLMSKMLYSFAVMN